MMSDPRPIGVFDSGLGGLSIWRAVRASLPDWPITYLADQAYCPYGPRSRQQIIDRSLAIGHYLMSQGATILVVALIHLLLFIRY